MTPDGKLEEFDGAGMSCGKFIEAERTVHANTSRLLAVAAQTYAQSSKDDIRRIAATLVQHDTGAAIKAIRRLNDHQLGLLGLFAKLGISACSLECIRDDMKRIAGGN